MIKRSNLQRTSFFYHLAGLAMHVEVDCNAVGHFTSATVHQVLSQSRSEVALTCPTRPRKDKAAMLK